MAYIPVTKNYKLSGNSIGIIQGVVNSASGLPKYNIVEEIPKEGATENMVSREDFGKMLAVNNEWSNSFIATLLNKIVFTVLTSYYFTNPYARFKEGYLEAGDAVEELVVALCRPHEYDSTDDNEFPKQEIPEVGNVIHKLNYKKYYKQTVNRDKLLAAFTTKDGMERLAQEIIDRLYTSASRDEFLIYKYMIARRALDSNMVPVQIPSPDTKENMEEISGMLMGISNDMTFVGNEYSPFGWETVTEKDQQIVFINTKFAGMFNTKVLANAFNMDRAQIEGQRYLINGFSMRESRQIAKLLYPDSTKVEEQFAFTQEEIDLLNTIPIFVVDERFFKVWDYLEESTEFFNPEKLYWNYWYHVWRVVSSSPFVNALFFTTAPVKATELEITPQGATVAKGSNMMFYAKPSGEGFLPYYTPKWTITGAESASTTIVDGLLSVSLDETAEEITITAAIAVSSESEITATAVVRVG